MPGGAHNLVVRTVGWCQVTGTCDTSSVKVSKKSAEVPLTPCAMSRAREIADAIDTASLLDGNLIQVSRRVTARRLIGSLTLLKESFLTSS